MKKPAMSLDQLKPNHSKTQAAQPRPTPPSAVALYPVHDLQFLLFNGPDMISRQLRTGQYWESTTLEILKNFLLNLESPVFIDIGANIGSITIPIGKFIQKKNGKVISFEAQRGVYYQLCGNIFSNQLIQTCTAHHIAIGNIDSSIQVPQLDLSVEANVGSLSLDADIRRQQNTLSTKPEIFENVRLVKIDSLDLPAASMIKIDVEGLELEVLQGAQKYIESSNYPPLFFEIWGDYMKELIPKREQLMSFIKDTLGYQTTILGELCIAQHPQNQYFNIVIDKQKSLVMTRLK